MKLSLLEVKNKYNVLNSLGDKKLPVKLSYAIGKNFLKLKEEVDIINQATKALLEQYAEKDDDGNPKKNEDGTYVIEDETCVNAEYEKFLKDEVDITIHTVPESILEESENERYDVLTIAEIVALDFMVEKPAEAAETKA